jgi:predicted small secreted protein
MRTTRAVLLAAALAASATPAAACNFFRCLGEAVADDSYPPGQTALPLSVQMEVIARQDRGLSLAGFYNDPSLALAQSYYAAPRGPILRRAY